MERKAPRELSVNVVGKKWVAFAGRKPIAKAKTFREILRKLR